MERLTFTEENHLKAIFKLAKNQQGNISTNAIAEQTQTRAASVTDMLRKLAEKELIYYQKYQGVILTTTGEKIALQVIRKHRLWEVFLAEKLGFGWDEVHDIAEQLEHIISESLITRLDDFLGNPLFDPHGDPIPDATGKMTIAQTQPLAMASAGMVVIMAGVSEHSSLFLQHLGRLGLTPDCGIEILEKSTFDQSLYIKINHANPIFISQETAKNILVK